MITFETLKVNGRVYIEINDGEYSFCLPVEQAIELANMIKKAARSKDALET